MKKTLIINGLLCGPVSSTLKKADILVSDGRIEKISSIRKKKQAGTAVIDAGGKIVAPGLIDMHTHLREPGREDEETILTGTRAAAMGGFTTVCAMANTNPVTDSVSGIRFIIETASKEGLVNVLPVGAVTKGSAGTELAAIGKMRQAGAVAISDDGNSVMNSMLFRRAMDYSKMFNLTVISHCEDINLSRDGEMNEGFTSTVLGLKGIPAQAEEIMVARDIALSELTGTKLHIAHISTAGSVELVRQAKKKGLNVTCETAPHYFFLTDEEVRIRNYDTCTRVNPPLRSAADVAAIKKGLADGTIDCIATDHAPHLEDEKMREYRLAPCGMIGLETALPLVWTGLVNKKVLTPVEAIRKMTANPAKILEINSGRLEEGAPADITIIDPKQKKRITKFESKCSNSPFIGMELTGFAVLTMVSGRIVMCDGKII